MHVVKPACCEMFLFVRPSHNIDLVAPHRPSPMVTSFSPPWRSTTRWLATRSPRVWQTRGTQSHSRRRGSSTASRARQGESTERRPNVAAFADAPHSSRSKSPTWRTWTPSTDGRAWYSQAHSPSSISFTGFIMSIRGRRGSERLTFCFCCFWELFQSFVLVVFFFFFTLHFFAIKTDFYSLNMDKVVSPLWEHFSTCKSWHWEDYWHQDFTKLVGYIFKPRLCIFPHKCFHSTSSKWRNEKIYSFFFFSGGEGVKYKTTWLPMCNVM